MLVTQYAAKHSLLHPMTATVTKATIAATFLHAEATADVREEDASCRIAKPTAAVQREVATCHRVPTSVATAVEDCVGILQDENRI